MSYWRRLNPRGGLDDFLDYWRQPTPYRWQILGVSVALTFTLMVLFVPENQRAEPRRPEVTYISTFEAGRTDEQIRASNLVIQRRQDELRARRAALEERKMDRQLGRATGVDVDAMEERIAREERELEVREAAARDAAARDAAADRARTTGDE